MVNAKVDVLIPTYRPDDRFVRLMEMLAVQSYPIAHIRVINTERVYWDEFVRTNRLPFSDDVLRVTHVSADEFDHGGTRRMGVESSDADIFVMMTQDAVPYDEYLIENLVTALEKNEEVAVAYARQLPCADASVTEKYVRSFNYPDESAVKGKDDIPRLGIKTFFCSNVCAAYRRDRYDEVGGFVKRTIFNEDMIIASAFVKAGYKIAYVAQAKVLHSHNYSGAQQFHRNFDLAVSQAEHPEVFGGLPSEGEGMKLVKGCIRYLNSIHKPYLVPGFIINCGCRYLGFTLGKNIKVLPKAWIKKMSSNPAYWN